MMLDKEVFIQQKKQIRSINDFKGLKIRVQKSELMYDLVKSLGAVPIQLSFEEVYTSLYTGIIDGAENNFPSYVSKLHYKAAKYYTIDSHTRIPEILLFSKKKWDKLSKKDQQLIKKAAKESVTHQRKLWEDYVSKAIDTAEKEGCIITEIDQKPFVKAMEPVYNKYGLDFKDYITEIQNIK